MLASIEKQKAGLYRAGTARMPSGEAGGHLFAVDSIGLHVYSLCMQTCIYTEFYANCPDGLKKAVLLGKNGGLWKLPKLENLSNVCNNMQK